MKKFEREDPLVYARKRKGFWRVMGVEKTEFAYILSDIYICMFLCDHGLLSRTNPFYP